MFVSYNLGVSVTMIEHRFKSFLWFKYQVYTLYHDHIINLMTHIFRHQVFMIIAFTKNTWISFHSFFKYGYFFIRSILDTISPPRDKMQAVIRKGYDPQCWWSLQWLRRFVKKLPVWNVHLQSNCFVNVASHQLHFHGNNPHWNITRNVVRRSS